MDRIINNSVRYSGKRVSRRDRQCYECTRMIKKGEEYCSHQFRYDKTIITVSFHNNCFNLITRLKRIIIFGGYAYVHGLDWPFQMNEMVEVSGLKRVGVFIAILENSENSIILCPVNQGPDIRLIKDGNDITAIELREK